MGLEEPPRGKVKRAGEPVAAGLQGVSSRATPQTICRRLVGFSGATEIAEALTATRLWEHRHLALNALSDSGRAACEMLPCLLRSASLYIVDRALDRLDPWAVADIWAMLEAKLRAGAALVVSTNDLCLAETCDSAIVVRKSDPVFFGTVDELLSGVGPVELQVETCDMPGVRALVESVAIAVEETAFGLKLQVVDGQETAVRLLLQGYGHVKCVGIRRAHLKDALLERFGG